MSIQKKAYICFDRIDGRFFVGVIDSDFLKQEVKTLFKAINGVEITKTNAEDLSLPNETKKGAVYAWKEVHEEVFWMHIAGPFFAEAAVCGDELQDPRTIQEEAYNKQSKAKITPSLEGYDQARYWAE